jgi:trehalose 6-phosphate phosphatase
VTWCAVEPIERLELRQRVDQVGRDVEALADGFPGLRLEGKPVGVAVHYREVAPAARSALLGRIAAGPARRPGIHTQHGKMVVELLAVSTSKGQAITTLRRQVKATATLYVGDDLTDEDAFAMLGREDVSVKVGSGPSAARYRLDHTDDVAQMLARLATRRSSVRRRDAPIPVDSLD